MHGNLAQNARQRNLAAFAVGRGRVLVATDIAARGIHVDDIALVIHADPPAEHKAYLHRSGRTARAGADGVVITLQTAAQANDVRTLMRRADVVPQTATVGPDSELLHVIAGPQADRLPPPRHPRRPRRRPANPAPGTPARAVKVAGVRPPGPRASRGVAGANPRADHDT